MKESVGSRVFDCANYALLGLFSLAALYPFWDVVQISLSHPNSLSIISKINLVQWVKSASFDMYPIVFSIDLIKSGFLNSIIQTALATLCALMINSLAAYPLSKSRIMGRNIITVYIAVTMFFSGGMIPTFILVNALGMFDTIWAIIIPGAFGVWHMIMMRTFFQNIPEELEEAAQMEGANDLYVLFKIYIPLSKALYATMALFFTVSFWNNWFTALIYLRDNALFPLQLVLRNLIFFSFNSQESGNVSPITIYLEGVGVYKGSQINSDEVEDIFKAAVMVLVITPLISPGRIPRSLLR